MGNLSLNQRRVIIIVLVVLLICIGSGFVYLLFFLTPPAPVPPIAVIPTVRDFDASPDACARGDPHSRPRPGMGEDPEGGEDGGRHRRRLPALLLL